MRSIPARFGGRLHRIDPGLVLVRATLTTMTAVLCSFFTAWGLETVADLTTNVVIQAVVLTVTLSRVDARHRERNVGGPRLERFVPLVLIPLLAVAADEVGSRMVTDPNLGDSLFVVGIAGSIWVRRFGALATRLGTLASLPFVATLVVPGPAAPIGTSSAEQRWWTALVGLIALFWARLLPAVAHRAGWLPTPVAPVLPPPRARPASTRKLAVSDRMAAQIACALGIGFWIGRTWFDPHWTWIVLTVFIVCSGNRGREDVAYKGLLRVGGAAVGTLAATALSGRFATGDRWAVVVIFLVLATAMWLRSFNYAFWAGGMTAALALLYGYFGESGLDRLGERLAEILIGAGIAVVVSWVLLPVRTGDVLRRYLADALAALHECLLARRDGTDLAGRLAGFRFRREQLATTSSSLRLAGRHPSLSQDHRWAHAALLRCERYLAHLAEPHQAIGRLPRAPWSPTAADPGDGRSPLKRAFDALTGIRRALGARTPITVEQWAELDTAVAALTPGRTMVRPG